MDSPPKPPADSPTGGDKVSTGKTTIRVFPTAPTITYSLRTNEWSDQMIETVCNPDVRQRTTEDEILEMLCGHKGSELRTLLLFGIFAFREGLNELHYKREYFTADS
ncbi:unnamed protein product [Rotaria sordida]|uniref:Uncharacterized protein n=1 Tax=Rotaria sordida TaxID=392033 RepID=A0A819L8G1_9BILA|nr:unnamed protein product [Rotaria sordida]CAF3985410.1 unnamed protein product [Rotaria sordida]CAF4036333.1 unnamed protein product [Rotaria sordida]